MEINLCSFVEVEYELQQQMERGGDKGDSFSGSQ